MFEDYAAVKPCWTLGLVVRGEIPGALRPCGLSGGRSWGNARRVAVREMAQSRAAVQDQGPERGSRSRRPRADASDRPRPRLSRL